MSGERRNKAKAPYDLAKILAKIAFGKPPFLRTGPRDKMMRAARAGEIGRAQHAGCGSRRLLGGARGEAFVKVRSAAIPAAAMANLNAGAPYGNRTRVSAVKGRRPGPLDEGRWSARRYKEVCLGGQATGSQPTRAAPPHHFPVFAIDFHGSVGGSGLPFCSSSIECLSGERTNAMLPSRGGRLMVTPAFISLSQVA
jgi:hypothetical protein